MVDLIRELSRSDYQALHREDVMLKDSHVLVTDPNNPRIGIIRTSDRIAFKRCRRRWGWSSHLRHNLGPRVGIAPLWFGTGIHFALEDFHGYNRFGHPKAAFEAFVKASIAHRKDKLPDDWEEHLQLGRDMMDYYIVWLQQRHYSALKTYWHEGVPQVEVNFKFLIPGDWSHYGYDEVYYSGTIDRVCIDDYGNLWPADYKTCAVMQTLHYLSDPQVGAYSWATPHLYDKPVAGFLYMQFRKQIPNPGRILKNGHVSTDQSQATTHLLYRQTLIDVYGAVEHSPSKNQELLNYFAMMEDEDKDSFIRIDRIHRNEHQGMSEGTKILLELEDMLNPNLPLYPNPDKDCQWCSFLSPCTSMDSGLDWETELELTTEPREAKYDGWRDKIIWPGEEDPKIADYGDRDWLQIDATTEVLADSP